MLGTNITLEKPLDVATIATVSFIESLVPDGASIVEVGCGGGDVTALLSKNGYQVTGLDSDPTLVANARKHGINVVHAAWPNYSCGAVDALVFTRSLHHISPLPDAIAKASEVMKPEGLLLVEDFAFDHAQAPAIDWFLKVIRSQAAQSLLFPVADELVTVLLCADDAASAWREMHDHDLHTATDMKQAIATEFTSEITRHVAYLYRYLIPVLPETRDAAAFLYKIFLQESELGDAGELSLIGRRIVAGWGSPATQSTPTTPRDRNCRNSTNDLPDRGMSKNVRRVVGPPAP